VLPKLKDIEHKSKEVGEFRELSMKVFNEVIMDRECYEKDKKRKELKESFYNQNLKVGDRVIINSKMLSNDIIMNIGIDILESMLSEIGIIKETRNDHSRMMYKVEWPDDTLWFYGRELVLVEDKPESSNYEEWVEENKNYRNLRVGDEVIIKTNSDLYKEWNGKIGIIKQIDVVEHLPYVIVVNDEECIFDEDELTLVLSDVGEDSNYEEWVEEKMTLKYKDFIKKLQF
jgi:hypothetical protein